MRIIALAGAAGAGKSTVASMLVPRHPVWLRNRWVEVRDYAPPSPEYAHAIKRYGIAPLDSSGVELALADKLKEVVFDLYDAPCEQLWGSSEERSKPLFLWPLDSAVGRPTAFLTTRVASQTMGTEGGRATHPDTWTWNLAKRIAEFSAAARVEQVVGGAHIVTPRPELVVVPDVRFPDEVARLARGLDKCAITYHIELWYVQREAEGARSDAWRAHESEAHTAALAAMASTTIINRGAFGDMWTDVRAAFYGEQT